MFDLGVIGGEVYINGKFEKTNLYINNGIISKIDNNIFNCHETYNAMNKKVLPGLIDPHVHFELGGGQYISSDDFESGSISAAYGGITTFIDFLDPIDNGEALEEALIKRRNLAKKSVIDYSFHVTVKNPKNQVNAIFNEMKRLKLHRIKLFTTYSDSGRRTYDKEIRELLELSEKEDLLILAHVEDDEKIRIEDSFTVKDLPISRPSKAETSEALKLAKMVQEIGGKLYMVHTSSGNTVKMLKEKYKDIIGKSFIIESCPHYFVLDDDVYSEKQGYLYTMAPPLRTYKEQQLLFEYIDDITTIGTDHCPFMSNEKNKEKLNHIPMGIGGVEHSFNIMYSLFKDKIIDKMTINPAKIHGLFPRKGVLQEDSDGDFIIIEENENIITNNRSKCDYSVYNNFKVNTSIIATCVRGRFVIKDGKYIGGNGTYIP